MREPDDIKPVDDLNYYHKSLDLAGEVGIRGQWESFFMNLYRKLELLGVVFNERVRLATQQTNQHFEIRIDAGINEHDYV